MKPVWFFIIFAPGFGGNHIANIVSTDLKFIPRVPDEFYSDLVNSNAPPPDDKIFKAVDHNQVICCHLSEFIWNKSVYENFNADIKFLVVEFPPNSRSTLLTKRIEKLYPYYQNKFLIEELSTLYSTNNVRALLGHADITPLPADLLFTSNAGPLVEYLQSQYDLNFDLGRVQKMHSAWVDMIKSQ